MEREAKEKIASVVLGDIYDILSDGKNFDEAVYNHKLKLLVEGYEALDNLEA